MLSCCRPSAAILLFCLLGASAASAQEDAPAVLFQDQVRVEVVSIDVQVLDRDGNPVEGLKADDFVLRVDGKKTPVTNFYAAQRDGTTTTVEALPEREAPVQAIETTPDPFHVVLFFDNLHMVTGGRERLVGDLPPFLERQIADGGRVMISALTSDGIKILTASSVSAFTNEPAAANAALTEVSEMAAMGRQSFRDRYQALRDIQLIYDNCRAPSVDPCECMDQMTRRAENYSASIEAEQRSTLAAVSHLVDALGSLEGRKSLLYVSDGFEHQPGLDVFRYIDELCPDARAYEGRAANADGMQAFNRLVQNANANRVTFFSLKANSAAMVHGSAEFGASDNVGGGEGPSSFANRILRDNLESSLHFLANETGGRAVLNANQFDDDLTRMGREIGTYYSLGFSPSHPAAGKSHDVKVKVPKVKGVRLSYRRSFLHKQAEQLLAEKAVGVLLLGNEANPLDVAIRTGAATPGPQGSVLLPLEIRVPLARLTLLPADGERRGQLTLIVASPAANGSRQTQIRRMRLDVQAPLDEGASPEDYRFGVRLELPPGEHEIGLSLWDDVAETASFLRVPVGGVPNA